MNGPTYRCNCGRLTNNGFLCLSCQANTLSDFPEDEDLSLEELIEQELQELTEDD